MKKLDKLLQAAELEYAKQRIPDEMPRYDYDKLDVATLKGLLNGEFTEREIDDILAPIRIFDTEEEIEAARAAGFKGVAFYGENDLEE